VAIEKDDILRIADLAGLPPPADMERVERDLTGILAQMKMLAEVPLDDDGAGTQEATAPLRTDEPGADTLTRPVRELAPAWREGFFTVPRLPALGEAGGVEEDREAP
jgi:Asp-tRNA(Asn)/Glu-tRNA(Gln) amidotransferase C subunit